MYLSVRLTRRMVFQFICTDHPHVDESCVQQQGYGSFLSKLISLCFF
jgi:hypothetical protein